MTPPRILRALAVLCGLTAAAIGFIDGFQTNPTLYWPWAQPIGLALIAAGLALVWASEFVVRS